MARRKKTSAILTRAEQRLSGLRSIDSKVDLGHGVTPASLQKEIELMRLSIDKYNTLLSQVDDASNAIGVAEKQLSVLAENVLLGVKMKYGKDSSQYEMAGGTRLSDRRRRRVSQPVVKTATV